MATAQYLPGVRDAQGNPVPVPANPNAVWKQAYPADPAWNPSPTQAAKNVTTAIAGIPANSNPSIA